MSERFLHNETMTSAQTWFIFLDILSLVFIFLVIAFAILFLFLIMSSKIRHTVPMMLITNSCIAHLIFALDRFWIAGFRFQNDWKNIPYEDSLCRFRISIAYTSCAILNYSYFLQAIYRYICVVYPMNFFWQSRRIQFGFICLTWIFSIGYPFIFVFKEEISYDMNNHICQLPMQFSFSLIYMLLCSYIIPVFSIIIIYFRLIQYIHMISQRVTPVNILIRAKRQLKMVQNIVILITMLFITGLPYGIFIIMSFFHSTPKYHCRYACVFFDVFSIWIMITLFQFTKPLKMTMTDKFTRRSKVTQ